MPKVKGLSVGGGKAWWTYALKSLSGAWKVLVKAWLG
jgi:hypothetical protein